MLDQCMDRDLAEVGYNRMNGLLFIKVSSKSLSHTDVLVIGPCLDRSLRRGGRDDGTPALVPDPERLPFASPCLIAGLWATNPGRFRDVPDGWPGPQP